MLQPLQTAGALEVCFGTSVQGLIRLRTSAMTSGDWQELGLRSPLRLPPLFLGQAVGPCRYCRAVAFEAADYAGFPVSGQWLVCGKWRWWNGTRRFMARRRSVPRRVGASSRHPLDDGQRRAVRALCGIQQQVPGTGSLLDLPLSVRFTNLLPMLQVGVNNLSLVKYLINQLRQSETDRMEALRAFLPKRDED